MNIYTVVHVKDEKQGREQALLALSLGVDGVYFISHFGNDELVVSLAKEFIKSNPDKHIGINLLSTPVELVLDIAISNGIKNVWMDNAGINTRCPDLELIANLAEKVKATGLTLFAGVAFKYQRPETNFGEAAVIAAKNGFIPVTSGPGTGQSSSLLKLKEMYDDLGQAEMVNSDLALASGVNCHNIRSYEEYISHVFVATGVSKNEHELDENKLSGLLSLARKK